MNALQEEIAGAIETTGINLETAATDANTWGQLSKTIANYVQNGRYYTEASMLNNAYVLAGTNIGGLGPLETAIPTKLTNGAFMWKVTTPRTGTGVVTLELPGNLDVKNLVRLDGTNPTTTDLQQGAYAHCLYEMDNDRFVLLDSKVPGYSPGMIARITLEYDSIAIDSVFPLGPAFGYGTGLMDTWWPIRWNAIYHQNDIPGLTPGDYIVDPNWGPSAELFEDINLATPGRYIISATVPYQNGNGDTFHAIRFSDGGVNNFQGVSSWAEVQEKITCLVDVPAGGMTFQIQRIVETIGGSRIVKSGGLHALNDPIFQVLAECVIQKVA
jgi:hypothetical protein